MAIPEKELKQSSKQPRRHTCHLCHSPEGYGADGKPSRLLSAGDGIYECNYCSSQAVDETINGRGACYGGFEVQDRSQSDYSVIVGFENGFERQGSLAP